MSWGISPDFSGLSPCYRQIAYALLTRAPVAAKSIATLALPLDLHVLGLSLLYSFLYTFEDLPAEIDVLSLLYYTCFFPIFSMSFTFRLTPVDPAFFRKAMQR